MKKEINIILIYLLGFTTACLLTAGMFKLYNKPQNNKIIFPKFYHPMIRQFPHVTTHKMALKDRAYEDSVNNAAYIKDTIIFLDSVKRIILNNQ